jgi:branched-subunit amino acid transport protein AzlD
VKERRKIPWRLILPPLLTAAIFVLIFRKVPFARFTDALRDADYVPFFAALLPFSIFYFALDSVVLWRVVRWFHGDLALSDLLPVRAVDYLLSILNHRVSQGAMVVYLARRLSTSLLEIASSILFLDFLQRTHLILWAGIGMALVSESLPLKLLLVPLGLALIWAVFLSWVHGFFGKYLRAPDWRLFRTFRLAPASRYAQVLLWKAPLLLGAVFAHYHATRAFGFEIEMPRLLATLPIIFMVGSLPINVARLGTTPLAWIFFHGDVVDPPKLLAYSLAGHLTFMLANAGLGLAFLPRAYRELFSSTARESLVDSRLDRSAARTAS